MIIRRQMFMSVYDNIVLRTLPLLAAALCQVACSDKSNGTSENQPPSTPILVQPLDGAVAIPTSVTLAWEASDPDGDLLSFEILLDDKNPPTAQDVAQWPAHSRILALLSQGVTYFWRVTATDEKGASSPQSVVSRFTVGTFRFGWRDRLSMPTSRTSVASVVSTNRLYVLGGISDLGFLDICEVYDPAGDNWTQIASLPSPRAYASAVEHQGKVIVLGGETSQDQLAIVESYNPSTNTWTQLTPLPSPRSRFGTAVFNDKIYVFGGYRADGKIYAYDISSDDWRLVGTLPKPRDGMSVTVHDGLVYVVGGSHPDDFWLTDVTVYDPNNGAFSSRAPMPSARRDHRASLVGDKIYISGGMNAIGLHIFFSSIEVYDISEDSWLTRSQMKFPRHDHAAGAIGGKLYTAGGLTNDTPGILNSLEEYDPLLDP